MGRYLSRAAFAARLGVTEDTVRGWMGRHWQNGDQYATIGHTTLIDVERAELWITQKGFDRAAAGCGSESGNMAGSRIRKLSPGTSGKVTSPLR